MCWKDMRDESVGRCLDLWDRKCKSYSYFSWNKFSVTSLNQSVTGSEGWLPDKTTSPNRFPFRWPGKLIQLMRSTLWNKWPFWQWFKTLRPKQIHCHLAERHFKQNTLIEEYVSISIRSLLKLIPKSPTNNNPGLLTHKCVTWSQCVDITVTS